GLALFAEEFGESGAGLGSQHQACADEESIEACGAEFGEFFVSFDAGFTYRDAVFGNAGDEFVRGFGMHFESSEIAIVDADDAGVGSKGAVELLRGVDFDQRLHLELASEGEEIAEQAVAQGGDDEEKTVSVVRAGFPDLPGVEDEIFAEDG